MNQTPGETGLSWYARNEFLIRRLHSLCGLVPVGAYMVVHLAANASILNGVESFQTVVYQIHSLGKLLPLVEWGFIFIPLLFHAILGILFVFGGKSNIRHYPTTGNYRYVLQRITGLVAAVFIFSHVMHLNGLIHAEWFREGIADAIGLAQFRPYNAASTAAKALQNPLVMGFYIVGLIACVYHFANGIWTMGITWGVWVTPRAQAMADRICVGLGVIVLVIGLSALGGFWTLDADKAYEREKTMLEAAIESGAVVPDEHKIVHE